MSLIYGIFMSVITTLIVGPFAMTLLLPITLLFTVLARCKFVQEALLGRSLCILLITISWIKRRILFLLFGKLPWWNSHLPHQPLDLAPSRLSSKELHLGLVLNFSKDVHWLFVDNSFGNGRLFSHICQTISLRRPISLVETAGCLVYRKLCGT